MCNTLIPLSFSSQWPPTAEYIRWNVHMVLLQNCVKVNIFHAPLRLFSALRIKLRLWHYIDVVMSAMASQITSLSIVYSTVYSNQRKHQSSASLAFVRVIHQSPVNSPHKGPVTRKMFPLDDVIMRFLKAMWTNLFLEIETIFYLILEVSKRCSRI